MSHTLSLPIRPSLALSRPAIVLAALALLLAVAVAVWAQVGGDRGIAPVAASSDIEVSGITVDVQGDTAVEAREKGWIEAQRKAWAQINGPQLSDSQLAGIVSAIVIERERLGPRRYIATLGVVFDRARASGYLGEGGQAERSAPMLLLPVTISAGSELVYETRNPWQRAWAEFQPGSSRVDYVRPVGAGGDSLLLNYGQIGRRSRIWWRNVLDQYGAADVLVAIARLHYVYPGGPVEGTFTARHGPDNRLLSTFTMTAKNPADLPAMLTRAVKRFDGIYQGALASGQLAPDNTLNLAAPELDPALARLVELGRLMEAQDRAAAERDDTVIEGANDGDAVNTAPIRNPPPEGSVALYTVQFATPDTAAFDAAVTGVRSAPGVKGAGTRSTAIGGTSVMTVSFAGSIDELAAALRGRGFTVRQGGNALHISR